MHFSFWNLEGGHTFARRAADRSYATVRITPFSVIADVETADCRWHGSYDTTGCPRIARNVAIAAMKGADGVLAGMTHTFKPIAGDCEQTFNMVREIGRLSFELSANTAGQVTDA